MGLCGLVFAWTGVPAKADVRSYCEAYARNQADVHLSGSAILGFNLEAAPAEQENRKTLALADCLALYIPMVPIEPSATQPETAATNPVIRPRAKPAALIQAKKSPDTPKTKIEAAATTTQKKKQPVTSPSSLVAGSPEWKAYCAAKYVSYNPATNIFTNAGGEQRPCIAKSQPRTSVAKASTPSPAATGKLPTRAAKSVALPPSKRSPWHTFDNPGLSNSR